MDYTRRLQRYFGQRFSAQGGTVVLRAGFRTGEHDIAKLLAPLGGQSGGEGDGGESAMPLRAQLLFVAAGPDDAGPLVCKLRAAGYRQPIMGGDSYDSPELISTAEETGGGVYFATHAAFGLAHSTIAMRKFTTWYRSAYGRPPENAFAGLGFDAITYSPRRSCGRSPRTPGRCAMRCWRRAASTASRAACELR
jgi:branched-chain amino acid transport system substrate-binding protein